MNRRLHRSRVWRSRLVASVPLWVRICTAADCLDTSSHRTHGEAFTAAVAHFRERHPRRRAPRPLRITLHDQMAPFLGYGYGYGDPGFRPGDGAAGVAQLATLRRVAQRQRMRA